MLGPHTRAWIITPCWHNYLIAKSHRAHEAMLATRIEKRQRISRACDFCHQRGLRCRWTEESSRACLTCSAYDAVCTTNRPVKKRGRKPAATTDGEPVYKSEVVIARLLRIYLDTMYQCYFPFVSEKALLTRWDNGVADLSQSSYTLLMALCAVSAQVAASGAVFNTDLLDGFVIPDSRLYFDEAIAGVPQHVDDSRDLDLLRCFGSLAVYCLHQNDAFGLQRYLALYHAQLAQQSFHDETRWPSDISMTEADERRRLFWCVYRLEVHSACVTGHMVRTPEAHTFVTYPRLLPAMDHEARVWTEGWSYITDLFRLLEHAISCMHHLSDRHPALTILCDRPTPTAVECALNQIKCSKPRSLRGLAAFHTGRCTYMSIQITCTETLVTLMSLLYSQAPVSDIMELVSHFLEVLSDAPLIFFKVAGSQIVHQLLGVGHMLHNAARSTGIQYATEAKRLTAFLGDLVGNLGPDIPFAQTAGERLLKLAESTT